MKFLVLIFLIGLAAASDFQNVWEKERDRTIFEFMKGMKMAGPLRVAMGMPEAVEVDEVEDGIKTELGKKLKEALDGFLNKVKDALEHGKNIKEQWKDKIKEIVQHLKDIHEGIGDKAKEIIEKIKDKVKDFFDKLIKQKETRSIQQAMEAIEEINMKDIVKKALEMNGEGKRSLKEKWEELKQKIKDYFKDIHFDVKEKFSKVFEWLKDAVQKGLELAKGKTELLKGIVKEFIKHSKDVSKEVALEMQELMRPYKEDLGALWDKLKETVKEVIHRKD